MVIKPNVLQGTYVFLFGVLTAAFLLMSTLMLFSPPHAPAKAGLGDLRGLIMVAIGFVVFVPSYLRFQRKMRMTLPAWAKAAMFALGVAFTIGVGLLTYLWARAFL